MKLQTMNKSYCFFCVGTGGHVLPAKNLIIELLNSTCIGIAYPFSTNLVPSQTNCF